MEEVQRIRVGNTCVGLVGLKTVMAEASKKYGRSPAEDIGKQLVEALSMSNYIPQSGRALYEEALAREYLKQQGLVSDEADGDVLEIKVLGKGMP